MTGHSGATEPSAEDLEIQLRDLIARAGIALPAGLLGELLESHDLLRAFKGLRGEIRLLRSYRNEADRAHLVPCAQVTGTPGDRC